MNDNRTDAGRPQVKAGEGGRLDSWKKIAVHFNRDVTTVQRWEKREGMPVHRHVHDKRGSVYALSEELDDWIQSRSSRPHEPAEEPEAETLLAIPSSQAATPAPRYRPWLALATVLCIC